MAQKMRFVRFRTDEPRRDVYCQDAPARWVTKEAGWILCASPLNLAPALHCNAPGISHVHRIPYSRISRERKELWSDATAKPRGVMFVEFQRH